MHFKGVKNKLLQSVLCCPAIRWPSQLREPGALRMTSQYGTYSLAQACKYIRHPEKG